MFHAATARLAAGALLLAALLGLGPQAAPRHAQAAEAGPPELFASVADAGRAPVSAEQARQLAAYRSERGAAEVSVVRLRTDAMKSAGAVTLNLPAAAGVPLDVVRVTRRSAEDLSWVAKGADGASEAILVLHNGNVVGTIRSGADTYNLKPLGDGATALVRVDVGKLLGRNANGNDVLLPPRGRGAGRPRSPSAAGSDSGAEFTAVVAYTAKSKVFVLDMDATIQWAEDQTNEAYANSGINTRLRIVHAYQTATTEAGLMSTDMPRFMTPGDGYFDEVQALRETYKADVAILIAQGSDFCGLAATIDADADTAFAEVGADCIQGSTTFPHEIGHLQGARHDPAHDPTTAPFPYGHGYYYEAGAWRTVMSYECPTVSCKQITYFSSPDVTFEGVPTGNATVSDNARVLNETADRVANFRVGGPPAPQWHWASRGGSLGSFPDCGRTADGIGCWAASSAGHLVSDQSGDGDSWSGFADLAGSVVGPPACVVRGARVDCFVATATSRLAQITYDGAGWGGWKNLGMPANGRPSCVAGAGSRIDCFAGGKDKALYHIAFDGKRWKPYEKVGGSTVARPECVAHNNGIDCFIVDGNKNLQTRRLASGKWGTWKKLASGVGLAPQCLVSGATMDCFTQSAGRQLLKGRYTGTKWAAWTSLGGDVAGPPFCNRTASGFDCYWTTSASKLVRRQQVSGAWADEEPIGGSVQQRAVCLPGNAGRIDCLARGLDNSLQEASYD